MNAHASFASRRQGRSRQYSRHTFARRPAQKRRGVDVSRFINTNATAPVDTPYEPTHQFSDFSIDSRIKQNVTKKGYETPTPIQDQAIPHILAGRDVVGIANTGTGKTGAFLIPLLDKIVKQRSERVLVIVPTRELAQQIEEEFKGFSEGSGFLSLSAVGGININPQLRRLRERPCIVIGTPGRLKDLVDRRAIDLSRFNTVVLDEADRMLDMGFINDMRFLLGKMPRERHTLFFSATLSPEIEALIGQFLIDPIRVSVKTRDTAASVHQEVIRLSAGETKLDVLCTLLAKPEFGKVLIFGRTKYGVERLAKELRKRGIAAESIHGDKNQSKRQKALGAFKENRSSVLVATDVAARGIDVADISHVINYDAPLSYEDYIHRIGRTGRGGKVGRALTFID